MVKQICVHKITIALIVISGKSFVFIKIYGCDLRKVQISFFVPLDQLLVHSHRCGACSKSKNSIWLHDDLCRHDVCRFSAYVIVIFSCINNHNLFLLLMVKKNNRITEIHISPAFPVVLFYY